MNSTTFKQQQQFKKRTISIDGGDLEAFGTLQTFLQGESSFTDSNDRKNSLYFLQTPFNKTQQQPKQLNLFSQEKRRNSLSYNQVHLKPGVSSSVQKPHNLSLYDVFHKENANNKFDKLPIDHSSPKIMSVRERKEGVIQKLFEIGNETLKSTQKRNSINFDNTVEDQREKKRSVSLQMKMPLTSLIGSPNNGRGTLNHNNSSNNKLVNYKKIEGKTFAYENYVKGLGKLKEKPVELKEFSQHSHLQDNFIEEKIDKDYPIILGLSSNYKTLASSPQSPKDHDYKRHKMKKSQYLVRTAVKYIENQREKENMSNYDKSFHRLKGVVVYGRTNGKLNQSPQFTKGDNEIIRRYRQQACQASEQEEKQRKKKNSQSMENSSSNNQLRRSQIDSENEDDRSVSSVNSETRKFQEKQKEVKEKIMKEIHNLKDKMTKKAIQKKFFSQSKAEVFLRNQQMIEWAKIHDKDKLESVQKFQQQIQQAKSAASPQKAKEDLFQNTKQNNVIAFKSQDIMKRVLDLDKVKQSNRIRSQLVKAKNKIINVINMKQMFGGGIMSKLLTPNKNENSLDMYDNNTIGTVGSPKQEFIAGSIFQRNKAISFNSEMDSDLTATPKQTNLKKLIQNISPKSSLIPQQQQQQQQGFMSKAETSNIASSPPTRKKSMKEDKISNTKAEANNIFSSPPTRKKSIKEDKNQTEAKAAHNIDYQKIFINGLDDIINDIHKGNYL